VACDTSIMRKLAPALLAISATVACGSSSSESPDTSGDSGGDSSTSDASIDAPPRPTTHAACPTPTIAAAAEIPASGEISRLAIAWSGSEVGVLYSAKNDKGIFNPYFVRLDRTGKALGSAVDLVDTTKSITDDRPVAITSDGKSYVACWNSTRTGSMGVDCVVIAGGTDTAKPAFTGGGYEPRLAFDGINRAVVSSQGAFGGLTILDASGMSTGTGKGTPSFGFLAARWPGFIVATTETTAGKGKRIEWELFTSTGENDGNQSSNVLGELVALASLDGNHIGILDSSGDAQIVRLAAGTAATTFDTRPFSTSDPAAALAPARASFAAVWARYGDSTGNDVRYRALDAVGTLQGANVTLKGQGSGWVDAVAVDDGFLVVATTGTTSAPFTALIPTHLACP